LEQKTVVISSPEAKKQAHARRRRRRRKLLWGRVALVCICLAVAVGAILLPRAFHKDADGSDHAEVIPASDITMPDWVTQAFLPVNPYSRPGTALTAVNGLVVHNTGNPGTTAEQNRDYFASLAETGATSASSQFIIGIDGEIIQCVPLDEVAYASNSRNDDTLSIEVCHADETGEFSDAAYQSLVRLLSWLCDTYSLSTDTIIRHGDIIAKDCPKYYMNNPDEWEYLLKDVANY